MDVPSLRGGFSAEAPAMFTLFRRFMGRADEKYPCGEGAGFVGGSVADGLESSVAFEAGV